MNHIKKKTAGHIYFGIDKGTGEITSIINAERGLSCNCKCAQCGENLEARKGTKRRHHFAHVSNFDCLYANEIAIYLQAAKLLRGSKLVLPEIPLQFYSRKEIVSPSKTIAIESVDLVVKEKVYPPVLIVEAQGSKLRLVLNFGDYYNRDDTLSLAGESEGKNWSSLLINLPEVDSEEYQSEGFLAAQILECMEGKQWIYSRLAEQWRKRYLNCSEEPESHGNGYLCPIHMGKYKGKYSARWVDCMYCEYNVSDWMNCLCTANSGIVHITDFNRPASELRDEVIKKRKENDFRIAQEERRQGKQKNYRQYIIDYPSHQRAANTPTVESLQLEQVDETEIRSLIENSTDTPVKINGVRWVLCNYCRSVCRAEDMSAYGGRTTVNLGTCKKCQHNE